MAAYGSVDGIKAGPVAVEDVVVPTTTQAPNGKAKALVVSVSGGSLAVTGGLTDDELRASAVVVSSEAIGNPTDAAWDGVAASATVISLLKKIALNTAPA